MERFSGPKVIVLAAGFRPSPAEASHLVWLSHVWCGFRISPKKTSRFVGPIYMTSLNA